MSMEAEFEQVPSVAPRVRVCTVDGQYVQLRQLTGDEVMQLLEELDACTFELFGFDLDNGRSQVHVLRENIVRVDVDWELDRWSRFKDWLLAKLDRWL